MLLKRMILMTNNIIIHFILFSNNFKMSLTKPAGILEFVECKLKLIVITAKCKQCNVISCTAKIYLHSEHPSESCESEKVMLLSDIGPISCQLTIG